MTVTRNWQTNVGNAGFHPCPFEYGCRHDVAFTSVGYRMEQCQFRGACPRRTAPIRTGRLARRFLSVRCSFFPPHCGIPSRFCLRLCFKIPRCSATCDAFIAKTLQSKYHCPSPPRTRTASGRFRPVLSCSVSLVSLPTFQAHLP